MTEHEQFKWICDTIGYENKYVVYSKTLGLFFRESGIGYKNVDVREIIYTQEFMYKFTKYYGENIVTDDLYETKMLRLLFNHLDDPVSYLYNLLGGPTQEK